VEEEQARVRITGEVNFIGRGEVQNSLDTPYDIDSRPLSVGASPGQEDNPLANSEVYTDFDLGVKGKASEDVSVFALINTGNYLSDFALGGVDDFTLWNLYADAGVHLGALGNTQLMVGRFPFQLTPYTLKFVDPDRYTYVTKLDNGDYVLDGILTSHQFGKVKLNLFAAKAQPISDLISPDLLFDGSTGIEVSQIAGARAIIGTSFVGNLGLTYYQAGTSPGRMQIYGADVNTSIGSFGVSAEYAKSKPNDALETVIPGTDDNNTAWNAQVNWQTGKLALGAGYSTVETNYGAPGYWSESGRAVNLRNVQGPMANLIYELSPRLSVTAEGKFLEPDNDTALVTGRTSTDQGAVVSANTIGARLDKITAWKAGVKYGLTAANSVDLGYEQVTWEPKTGKDTEERYISIGYGHSFNPNASLKLLYQIVEYEQGIPNPYTAGDDYRGGVATAQFQFKF
jgi:predicted porin